jgi:hypothetical protein
MACLTGFASIFLSRQSDGNTVSVCTAGFFCLTAELTAGLYGLIFIG